MKMKFLSAALVLGLSSNFAHATDLADVYSLALDNDPQILRAAAERNAAQTGVRVSKADWWPQIDFTLGYSDTRADNANMNNSGLFDVSKSSSRSFNRSISLSQTLFSLATWKGTEIVEKQAYQAEVGYRLARQELMLRVTSSYFNVLRAIDGLEFAKAEQRAIERQLEQTKHRFNLGLTAITDVHEAQAQFDNAHARVIQAENGLAVALEGLREITNRNITTVDVLNTDLFSPSMPQPSSAQTWVEQAYENNLNLVMNRAGVDIAEQRIDLAKSGHYPTVRLTANYSNNDQRTSGRPSLNGMDSRSIGIQASVPIYSGGKTIASTQQARDNFVVASQTLEESRRAVERTVRTAYNEVVASISTIGALEQAVISAESAFKATQAGLEAGSRTIVDVLNSNRNLYDARRNLSEARYTYILNMLALEQAAGSIHDDHLVAISNGLHTPPEQ